MESQITIDAIPLGGASTLLGRNAFFWDEMSFGCIDSYRKLCYNVKNYNLTIHQRGNEYEACHRG